MVHILKTSFLKMIDNIICYFTNYFGLNTFPKGIITILFKKYSRSAGEDFAYFDEKLIAQRVETTT